jgi:hypothetical protein
MAQVISEEHRGKQKNGRRKEAPGLSGLLQIQKTSSSTRDRNEQVNQEIKMPTTDENINDHPFAGAEIISSYSRAQAIEDGELVDVSTSAAEAGIKYPTVVSRAVWSSVVVVPDHPKAAGESESGRLWDVVSMLATAIRGSGRNHEDDRIRFQVLATNSRGRKITHHLWAQCGPGDTVDPVITIMVDGED